MSMQTVCKDGLHSLGASFFSFLHQTLSCCETTIIHLGSPYNQRVVPLFLVLNKDVQGSRQDWGNTSNFFSWRGINYIPLNPRPIHPLHKLAEIPHCALLKCLNAISSHTVMLMNEQWLK